MNYRVAPDVVKKILPANFRPKCVKGEAIAGICLIRLEQIRPKGLPALVGISGENSAHRIAVEWKDASGASQEGVFIPRRDTDSRMTSLGGGRIFPGVHRHSRFKVLDSQGRVSIRIDAEDHDSPLVDIEVEETEAFPEGSIFGSLEESSQFFENGCIGYSARPDLCVIDGLRLRVASWRVTPVAVKRVCSAFYDDTSLFPASSIRFDHALLMRDILHEWHSEPEKISEPPMANQ